VCTCSLDGRRILTEVWDEAAGIPGPSAAQAVRQAEVSRLVIAGSALLLLGRHAFMAYHSSDSHRPVPGPAPGLNGTGQVADDLYLIAHHEVTGKPYPPPRVLGVGLAGGLLAELMDGDSPAVTLHRGYLVPVGATYGDPGARYPRLDVPVSRRK
jgi:hypothetical protein